MDLEKVKYLVSKGETEEIEFKRTTTQQKPATKTLCGMLNTAAGGYVLFGVSDRGELKGQEVTHKTLEELSAEFRQISPPAFPEMKRVRLKEKLHIIIVNVRGEPKGVYIVK